MQSKQKVTRLIKGVARRWGLLVMLEVLRRLHRCLTRWTVINWLHNLCLYREMPKESICIFVLLENCFYFKFYSRDAKFYIHMLFLLLNILILNSVCCYESCWAAIDFLMIVYFLSLVFLNLVLIDRLACLTYFL